MRPKPRPPSVHRSPSRPLPSIGLALRRRPRLWWAIVVVLALAVGLIAASLASSAEAARRAWGTPTAVLVATSAIESGARITDDQVRVEQRPAVTVPATALTEVPAGARAGSTIAPGEVIVVERLAAHAASAAAARLPDGSRAVAIPRDAGVTPPLAVGDRVDVIAALASGTAAGSPPGFTLAEAVPVVAVEEAAVSVAVPRATAPRIAVALGAGAVFLALAG